MSVTKMVDHKVLFEKTKVLVFDYKNLKLNKSLILKSQSRDNLFLVKSQNNVAEANASLSNKDKSCKRYHAIPH